MSKLINFKKCVRLIIPCVVLICGIVFAIQDANAEEIVDSGTCGANVMWELYKNGQMTIYGDGEMENYYVPGKSYTPWNDHLSNIRDVTICDGVSTVGDYAFYKAVNLRSIHLPNELAYIGERAFGGCTNLNTVEFPITPIYSHISGYNIDFGWGYGSFERCNNIATLFITGNDTKIPGTIVNFFPKEILNARKIVLSEAIRIIDDHCFFACNNLQEIVLPDKLESIGAGAFMDCTALTSIYIPDTVSEMGGAGGANVFNNNSTIYYVKKNSVADEYLKRLTNNIIYTCKYGHVWNEEYTIENSATCTEDGMKSIHCSVCDIQKENSSIVIPANHDFNQESIKDEYLKREADCTHPAEYYKSCKCGESSKGSGTKEASFESGNPRGHIYKDVEGSTVDATCTTDGHEIIRYV